MVIFGSSPTRRCFYHILSTSFFIALDKKLCSDSRIRSIFDNIRNEVTGPKKLLTSNAKGIRPILPPLEIFKKWIENVKIAHFKVGLAQSFVNAIHEGKQGGT